jgi:hypothetical protein
MAEGISSLLMSLQYRERTLLKASVLWSMPSIRRMISWSVNVDMSVLSSMTRGGGSCVAPSSTGGGGLLGVLITPECQDY